MFTYINLSDEFTQNFLLSAIGILITFVVFICVFTTPFKKQTLDSYLNEVKHMLIAANFDKKEAAKIIKLEFWETKYKQKDDVHSAISEYIRTVWLK